MDLAKQSVIDSMRKKLTEMQNLCTRAEIDDDMSTFEYLAHMADLFTNPSVRILATLYSVTKISQGEEVANELIEGYVNHLRSEVTGLTDQVDELASHMDKAQAQVDALIRSANSAQ